MIVVVTGSKSVGSAVQRVLAQLSEAGVELSAGSREVLLRAAPGTHFAGERVAPGGLALAMQASSRSVELTDADLRTINDRHSAQELSKDDVVVFQDYALSDRRITAPPIRFTQAALRKFAAQAVAGRSVCFDHRNNELIGATFDGDVAEATVRDLAAHWLRLRWYAVLNDQTSPERRQRVQDCRTGVLRFGSVGVFGGEWTFQEVEGPDGPEYFYEIDDSPSLGLREYSRVYIGAADGAGDHKFSAASTSARTPAALSPSPKPQVLCVL